MRANKHYHNIFNDLLSQKVEKPHTTGLDDTAIPHINIKVTEILVKKKTQYHNTINAHVPLLRVI